MRPLFAQQARQVTNRKIDANLAGGNVGTRLRNRPRAAGNSDNERHADTVTTARALDRDHNNFANCISSAWAYLSHFRYSAVYFLVCALLVAWPADTDEEAKSSISQFLFGKILASMTRFVDTYIFHYRPLFIYFGGFWGLYHLLVWSGFLAQVCRGAIEYLGYYVRGNFIGAPVLEGRPTFHLFTRVMLKCAEPAVASLLINRAPVCIAAILSALLDRDRTCVDSWTEAACVGLLQFAASYADILLVIASDIVGDFEANNRLLLSQCSNRLKRWRVVADYVLLFWPALYFNLWLHLFYKNVFFVICVFAATLACRFMVRESSKGLSPFTTAIIEATNYFTLEHVCLQTMIDDSNWYLFIVIMAWAVVMCWAVLALMDVTHCFISASQVILESMKRIDWIIMKFWWPVFSENVSASTRRYSEGEAEMLDNSSSGSIADIKNAWQRIKSLRSRLSSVASGISLELMHPNCTNIMRLVGALRALQHHYLSDSHSSRPSVIDQDFQELRTVVDAKMDDSLWLLDLGVRLFEGCTLAELGEMLRDVLETSVFRDCREELESFHSDSTITIGFRTNDDTKGTFLVELKRPDSDSQLQKVAHVHILPGRIDVGLHVSLAHVLVGVGNEEETDNWRDWRVTLTAESHVIEICISDLHAADNLRLDPNEILPSAEHVLSHIQTSIHDCERFLSFADRAHTNPAFQFVKAVAGITARVQSGHNYDRTEIVSLLRHSKDLMSLLFRNAKALREISDADRVVVTDVFDKALQFFATAAAMRVSTSRVHQFCVQSMASAVGVLVTANLEPRGRYSTDGASAVENRTKWVLNDDVIKGHPRLLLTDAAENPIIDWARVQRENIICIRTEYNQHRDGVSLYVDPLRWDNLVYALAQCEQEALRRPFLATGLIGEVSSGKTTGLNAILGIPLLTVGDCATSACPMRVRLIRTSADETIKITIRAPISTDEVIFYDNVEGARELLQQINGTVRAIFRVPRDEGNVNYLKRFFQHNSMVEVIVEKPTRQEKLPKEEDFVDLIGLKDAVFLKHPEILAEYTAFLRDIPAFMIFTTPLQKDTTLEADVNALAPQAVLVECVNMKDIADRPEAEACSALCILECEMNECGQDFFEHDECTRTIRMDKWNHPRETSLVLKRKFGDGYKELLETWKSKKEKCIKRLKNVWEDAPELSPQELLDLANSNLDTQPPSVRRPSGMSHSGWSRTSSGHSMSSRMMETRPDDDMWPNYMIDHSMVVIGGDDLSETIELWISRRDAAKAYLDEEKDFAKNASFKITKNDFKAVYGGDYLYGRAAHCVKNIRQNEQDHRKKRICEAVNLTNELIDEEMNGSSEHLPQNAMVKAIDDGVDEVSWRAMTPEEEADMLNSLRRTITEKWTNKARTFFSSLFASENPHWAMWQLKKHPHTLMQFNDNGRKTTPRQHVEDVLFGAYKTAFKPIYERLQRDNSALEQRNLFPQEDEFHPNALISISAFVDSYIKTCSPSPFICAGDHDKFAREATTAIRDIVTQRLTDLRKRLNGLAKLQATRSLLKSFTVQLPSSP